MENYAWQFHRQFVPRRPDMLEYLLIESDQVHFVDRNQQVTDAEQPSDVRMPARLGGQAMTRVDQNDRGIRRGRAGRHVSRVLLVTRRIGNQKPAPGGGEVPVRYIDRDSLLSLGLQAVRQQREVQRSGRPVHSAIAQGLHVVVMDGMCVVQEPADQGRLAVIHASCRREAQQRLLVCRWCIRHRQRPANSGLCVSPRV